MSVTVNIGTDRKRTANVVRSEVIRERIQDYLMRSGGRDSRDRYDAVRGDFVSTAIRVAERDGLRLWKAPDRHTRAYNALRSLQVLFGEVENISPGKGGTGARMRSGVNVGWVLDVWEHALDCIVRQSPLERAEARQAELARGGSVFDELENSTDGPQVFKIVADKPVSVRILDAYLNRDDEAMMRLAVEIESLELKVP